MKTFIKMAVLVSLLFIPCILDGCSVDEPPAPVVLTNILVDTENVKTTYYASEKLNLSGLKVSAKFSDGSTKILGSDEYTVSPADGSSFDRDGEVTVTINYKGMRDSFTVNVRSVDLSSIELDTTNVKKTYFASEKLNLSGLRVSANYSDGSTRILGSEEYTVSPADGSSFGRDGEVTVSVNYNGVSDSFTVNVRSVELSSVEFNTSNVKKSYFLTEKLNLDGLVVTAHFNDGSSNVLSSGDYTVSPSENSILNELGEKIVTINCNGESSSFKVTVLKNTLSDVSITFPEEYREKTDLLSYDAETKTFNSVTGYKNYVWWLDGEILSGITGTNYTPENLASGNHAIMLVVTDLKDEVYSATATFKVQK